MSSRPSRGAARLASILDALPDALLLVNCNGTVVNANTIALETFEAPGTALVGRGLLDLLPSFDSRRIPGSMRRPDGDGEDGRTKPTRMVARRTDGTEFPVEVTSANLEDGRTPYADPYEHHYTGDELLMLVVRDLSGTVDTEAELARQQRQTEMILRAAAEGVVGVDTEGKVVLVNPSAAQILGYRASDLGGQELHPLIHHSRPDGTPLPYDESPLADSLRSGRKHRVRGQALWAKDGRAVPVDLTTAPVRDGEQLVGAVMTFTDRRKYNALAERHAQLLAVLDESLRGPLEQLRSELGTLAADPAGQLWPEANQILHYLTAGYARMTTLVDNVLSYQALDMGDERLDRKPVSLDAVVADGVEGAIELIGPGRAQFAVHAPPIEAEVDPARVAQALAHLIADVAGVDATGNAPAGGGSGDSTIVVAAAQRGEVVRIEVRGPYSGGDPVHQPIVRGIVQRHGGVLQTHEVPGTNGSAYVLELPLEAGAAPVTERQPTDRERENATTVMPVPKERARGTADAPGASDASHAGRAHGDSGTGAGAEAGAAGVSAQASDSQTPTGRRRARRGPELGQGQWADPESNGSGIQGGTAADAPETGNGSSAADQDGSYGADASAGRTAGRRSAIVDPRRRSGQGRAVPELPSAAAQDASQGGQQGTSSSAETGAAPEAAGSRPTGRRRGRPSPAEEPVPSGGMTEGLMAGQVPEDADHGSGPKPSRRARHGGGSAESYGSLATAGDAWAANEDDDAFEPQDTAYAPGANGAGPTVPPQGTGAEPTGRRARRVPGPTDSTGGGPAGRGLPALPAARADAGQQAGWPTPDERGQQGLSPVPAQLRPAGQPGMPAAATHGADNTFGSQDTAYAPGVNGAAVPPQGTGADPTGRRVRRPAAPTDNTGSGAMPALPPGSGPVPAAAPAEGRQTQQPQPYGSEGGSALPHQAQPEQQPQAQPTGAQQQSRRVRRPLADATERSVPGQDRPAGAEPGAARQAFALPPAAADRAQPAPHTPDQPGDWPADEHGRDLTAAGPDADHTPPQAHPLPTGRRRARPDPAEEQQAQAPGGGAQAAPPQGAPAPGATAPGAGENAAGNVQEPVQPQAAPAEGMPGQQPQPYDSPAGPPPAQPQPEHEPQPEPQPQAQPTGAQPQPQPQADDPAAAQSRAISVRTLGQGVPFAQQIADQQRPQQTQGGSPAQPSTGSGRRRRLAAPPQDGGRTPADALEPTGRPRDAQQQPQPQRLLDSTEGRAYAIGAPDEGAEGPEPLDGPNGAIDVTDSQSAPPRDDELPPEPLDNPRRLLVWPAPDVSTQQALSDRGYRPVIVHSREEVDAQIAAFPAALFVDPLTGPITRTALQSLRTAAVAAEVPVLVTAGLGQATREAAYGADPAVLLKALAPRDSEQHPSRVLLIEAHDAIAGALSATLERRGMQVARAAADADAVTLATQMRPNLVVMDLMQVRRRRAGIVDWLRANGLLNRTPLVVYTSADMDPAELPRLTSGETVLFLAERSTSAEVQSRIVDLLAKIGAN
ncbi:PAS domain-containing protein [Streptomyces sp. NPDC004647]|uniref:response regulator n=1 Tax=Streptomyces sp. NPDC004647 TaxID=3154671 RepID=UPI0033AAA08B